MEIKLERLQATLKNVNNRKESHGDERILAIDLDFIADVPRELIDQFAVDKVKLSTAFWDKDGKPKYPQLGNQCLSMQYDNHRIQVTENGTNTNEPFIDGFVFSGCKIKKVKFNANNNGVAELSFQAQMTPQSKDVPYLLDLVEETVLINLQAMTSDMIEQLEAKDAEQAESQAA